MRCSGLLGSITSTSETSGLITAPTPLPHPSYTLANAPSSYPTPNESISIPKTSPAAPITKLPAAPNPPEILGIGGPHKSGPILQESTPKILSKFKSKSKLSRSVAFSNPAAKFFALPTNESMSPKLTAEPPLRILHSLILEHSGLSSQERNESKSVIKPKTSPAIDAA